MRKKSRIAAGLLALAMLFLLLPSPAYALPSEEDTPISFTDVLLGNASIEDMFAGLFENTITKWLIDLLNEAINWIEKLLQGALINTLMVERYFADTTGTTVLTKSSLQNVYNFIYTVAIVLATTKFLFKGFQIYVLWRNGDAEASPREMLVGAIEAEVAMIGFPYLYAKCADVVQYVSEGIMGLLGKADSGAVLVLLRGLSGIRDTSAFTLIFMLIWFVMLFVLWIRLIVQGFELLILRLGFPFSTLGLIDSDMALFKNYVQVFLKTFFTVVIQICLMSLALRVILTSLTNPLNVLFSLAIMSTALSTPRLLQQFLVPQGGGGGVVQKASSVAMLARTVATLIK